MKRLTCVLASLVLAATVVTVRPVKAEYLGTFVRDMPYQLEVVGPSIMSITILKVTAKGKLEVEDVLVLDGTQANGQSRTVPRDAIRLIFKLDAPTNGRAVCKIGQTQRFEIPVGPDHQEAVVDIEP